MQNHYYEIQIKSHQFMDEDDLGKLKGIIEDYFEMGAHDTEHVEVEHVDSEYI